MRAVNLLPESSRPRRSAGRMAGSAYVVIGVLAVVLIMVVAYVLTTNDISDKESEVAAAKAEAEAATARAGAFDAFSNFNQIKEVRLAAVRERATDRFDWERLMREVSHVIPSDVWLVSMNASSAPQDASGASAPATAPTGGAPATAADPTSSTSPSLVLAGCAKGQDSVADLMVRLRELHRAEDVELSQSSLEDSGSSGVATDAATASSSEGCPGRYQFDVTVTFSAQAPEQPRESVPAALGGGS
jgi:Tfp pilus assembly protein PilN